MPETPAASDASSTPNEAASTGSAPEASRAAAPAQKISPHPVVSTTLLTSADKILLVLLPGRTKKVGSAKASPVVDTTGCGDIFCAGAAALLASGADPVEAAAFGAELASEAAGVSGVEQTFRLISNRPYCA